MEFNKIAGALIGAALAFLLLNFFSTAIYGTGDFAEHVVSEGEDGEEHGPVLAYAVAVESTGAAEEEAPQEDLFALFSSADPAAGEKVFGQCHACHSAEEGENKVGPSLWDVVGRDIASVPGFAYSDAMQAQEGDWTPEKLSHFLADPRGYVPGTKMGFAGLDDPADRVNVIAWLNQHGDAPVDLTAGLQPLAPAGGGASATEGTGEPAPAAGPAGAAPAEGASGAAPAQGAEAAPAAGATQPVQAAVPGKGETMPAQGTEATVSGVETANTEKEGAEGQAGAQGTQPAAGTEGGQPAAAQTQGQAGQVPAAGQQQQPAAGQAPAAGQQAPAEGQAGQQMAAAAPAAGAGAGGDAEEGAKIFRRCKACHTTEPGVNRMGPSLHGVVGRDVASVPDFSYSDAMQAVEGAWTPERLAEFLADPQEDVPGTRMAFPGLPDQQDRIDLVTYLETLGD